MVESRVRVRESVRAAFEFTKSALPRTGGILALNALLSIALQLLSLNVLEAALLMALSVLAAVVANGALYRLGFAGEHPGDPEFRMGPLGFQWGGPETRLLGAMLLLAFFMVLAFLIWFVLAIVVVAIAMVAGGGPPPTPQTPPSPPVQATLGVLGLIFGCGAVFVLVRVSLYQAATVAERHVRIFSTWGLTRGQFWRILAAIILAALPTLVAGLIAGAFRMTMATSVAGAVLVGLVNGLVQIPLFNGLSAYLYRQLRPSSGLAGPFASV